MTTRPRIRQRSTEAAEPPPRAIPLTDKPPRTTAKGGPRKMPRVDLGLGVLLTATSKIIHTPTPLTRQQVAMMSAYGIQRTVMAKILRINVETLTNKYEEELEVGQDKATILVAGELFKLAMNGKGIVKLGAIKHWLNARGKGQFVEVTRNEHSGPEGTPIQSETVGLTDEERVVRLLQLLASGGQGRPGRDTEPG